MQIGYLRVSSKGQADNHSFTQQENEILQRYPAAALYREQFTGKTTDRPVLQSVMARLQSGDVLAVTKLDRLARSVSEGIQLIQELFDRGVAVHVLNVGLLENTSMGRFFLTTLLAVAELEWSMIAERMAGGKAVARQSPDFREGRPPVYSKKQKRHAVELLAHHSYKEVSEMTGLSVSTLTRARRQYRDRAQSGD